MDFVGIGRVAANTTLAACAAGLTAMIYGYIMSKKWDVSFTVNGFLAGLVAITCPCYWVSPTGAVLLGGDRRSDRVIRESNCWNGCASTIPSARFRCTASAASGARSRWVCSLAGKYGATGPICAGQLRSTEWAVLRRRMTGAQGPIHRQRYASPSPHSRVAMVVMSWSTPPECCACSAEGRDLRHGSARARHLRLSGIRHLRLWAPWGHDAAASVGAC